MAKFYGSRAHVHIVWGGIDTSDSEQSDDDALQQPMSRHENKLAQLAIDPSNVLFLDSELDFPVSTVPRVMVDDEDKQSKFSGDVVSVNRTQRRKPKAQRKQGSRPYKNRRDRYSKVLSSLFAMVDEYGVVIDLQSLTLPSFIASDMDAMQRIRQKIKKRVEMVQAFRAKHAEDSTEAVDSRAFMGTFIGSQTVRKVIEIDDYLLGTMAGGAADCSFWKRHLAKTRRMFQRPATRSICVSKS